VERLLTDLNGKEPVSAEDVQYVIEMSDGKGDAKDGQLARAEVKVAVAVWYTRVEEKSKKSSGASCGFVLVVDSSLLAKTTPSAGCTNLVLTLPCRSLLDTIKPTCCQDWAQLLLRDVIRISLLLKRLEPH
jgi:hypothetical protein